MNGKNIVYAGYSTTKQVQTTTNIPDYTCWRDETTGKTQKQWMDTVVYSSSL